MNSRRKPIDIEIDMERRILQGLSAEWTIATDALPAEMARHMSRPIFRLSEMRSNLGFWSPGKCEICINRKLAFESPWHAVREILRHEIAHQVADQVFHAAHQKPHGPLFRKACLLLGADPKASARIDLFHKGQKSTQFDKIRKLLALAKSQNRHEAESAMIKARSLMLKHGIQNSTEGDNKEFISVFLGKPALRFSRDIYHMSRLLQEYYFVEAVWISTYLLDRDRIGRVLEISGTPPHVETALYINTCINHFINKEWPLYRNKHCLNRYRRTDFAIGIIEGFRNRLKRETVSQEKDTKSLIEIAGNALKVYIHKRYPKIGWTKRYSSNTDQTVIRDGMKKGEHLVIAPGLSGNRNEPDNICLFLPQKR